MLTTILMFIAAMALSAVAGYYSVIGMTSIFAGAFYPIVIMTGILETSKVIVASWLYNNWKKTPFALRSYLTVSVVVLMGVTSMGIFGYLSKAHIEQAAAGLEQQAQLEKISNQIDNQNAIIAQANDKITNMGKQGNAANDAINIRIADANKIIETANQQIQPAIDEQQRIIDSANAKIELRAKGTQAQIDDIDKQVANLDAIIKTLIDQKRTTTATNRQADQKPQRAELAKQKAALIKQIDDLRNAKDPAVDAAKAEIARLRAKVDDQVKQARELINTLTSKLESGTDVNKMQADIDTLNARIKTAQDEIDRLTTDKFKIEAESRKLEVEVGPLKYIAQLIYGDNPDANLLERAVRYVIMTIIFVFDPLAVLMLIAANQGIAEFKAARIARRSRDAPEPSLEPEVISQDSVTDNLPMQASVVDDRLIDAISELRAEMHDLSKALREHAITNVTNAREIYISPDPREEAQIASEPLGPESFEPQPLQRDPITEDDLPIISVPPSHEQTEGRWQIIDQLEPTINTELPATTKELMDGLSLANSTRISNTRASNA